MADKNMPRWYGNEFIEVPFTNHPSAKWAEEQLKTATEHGSILDIAFPEVDPNGDERYIKKLAEEYVARIIVYKPTAVLCQGEMTLAFAIAGILTAGRGLTILAVCSERVTTEGIGTKKETIKSTEFKFVRFRKYMPPLPDEKTT